MTVHALRALCWLHSPQCAAAMQQQQQQQRPLGFARITADDARQQRERIASQLAQTIALQPRQPAATAAAAAAQKRPVGRPKRPRDATELLSAAASSATSAAPSITSVATPLDEPASKRGKYTNWFASPFLPDILTAYSRCHSARTTVSMLRRAHPDGRFARLSHATLQRWFDEQHRLLPQYQQQLEQHSAAARGRGADGLFTQAPAAEKEIKRVLLQMRGAGAPLNSRIIRWVMLAVLQQDRHDAMLLRHYKLSQQFISKWAREQLDWRWRARTTAASKLPVDWEAQGVLMAKRIAANMEMHTVHPSLVVNVDQTGVRLVPSAAWTYEKCNSSSVAVVGAEDKRQITACIASSLSGELLPLQLIFEGKTERSLPQKTAASIASLCHLTFSDNHWSSQKTMQQYVSEIVMPYAETCIRKHRLHADAHIILVLDVWSVHKSEEFRLFLRTQHPRIHLVFVPANCTSKLQVADVSLQRPFKHAITRRFNEWAVRQIQEQIDANNVIGLAALLKMSTIKPLALQWCIDSWTVLKERRELITDAWQTCCVSLYNVMDPAKRIEAVTAVARQELEHTHVPEQQEEEKRDEESEECSGNDVSDSDQDDLDVSRPVQFGSRRGQRQRAPAATFGYQLNSSAIAMTEDSEN
jgi:hypothetical protein